MKKQVLLILVAFMLMPAGSAFADCSTLSSYEKRQACKGDCSAISDYETREACKGDCSAISDYSIRQACKGDCSDLNEYEDREACKSCNGGGEWAALLKLGVRRTCE